MKIIAEYIYNLGLNLSDAQMQQLAAYVDLVWQKKDEMNLTSVDSKEEIWARHICDGLNGAGLLKKELPQALEIADFGSGAGYIGISIAIALPGVRVTLLESLEKRVTFMNWVVLKLGLKNVTILQERAVKNGVARYDVVFERAMGKLDDILDVCLSYVREHGYFIAFQSSAQDGVKYGGRAVKYRLPSDGDKDRYLVLVKKNGHN